MSKLDHKRQESAPASIHVGVLPANSEAAIWTRLVQPEQHTLSPDAARSILGIAFTTEDKARMHDLSIKAQEGTLTDGEQAEMDNYCRVGRLLDLLHSKARRSLKRSLSDA